MQLELVPVGSEHVAELARICHEAFDTLHTRHATHRDVPDLETGMAIISAVASRPDYIGVAALLDGRLVGSNFLGYGGSVAGVGPLTVDPQVQARGVGRLLMRWAVRQAEERGLRQVRLFQEALNTTTLSLYTTVGFVWRDGAAQMQATPGEADDPTVRPLQREDLAIIEKLSAVHYGFSRAADAAQLLAAGFPGFLRERDRRAVGYLIPSLFGHGAGESEADLLALVAHAARHVPPPQAAFICPLSRPTLFRSALAARHRTLKTLSYMSYGDFTPPPGLYLPSIQC